MKVSVILPVFNEAENVRKTIGEAEKVLRELGLEHEIIAVDDGIRIDIKTIIHRTTP